MRLSIPYYDPAFAPDNDGDNGETEPITCWGCDAPLSEDEAGLCALCL